MKTIFFVVTLLITSDSAFSQIVQDPATWTFETRKKDATHYTLLFHATVKSPWHIYAMQPGGDGSLIGTSFTFNKIPGITRAGNIKALTKAKTQKMEGIDGAVNLYTGRIDFAQEVSGKAGNTVTGTLEYQPCNDQMCLPPKKKTFSFTLR